MQISAIKPYTTSETYQKIYRQNKLKDTTVQESDFEAIDDTIANPFEQMDLSLA